MNYRLFSAALTLCLFAPLSRAQEIVVPLWPHATPEPAQTADAEVDVTKPTDALISGHRTSRITNVTIPTITVVPPPPTVKNTGASALVFPGGGYIRLSWQGEGTDTCDWLNSIGMTCLLVKYRVPEQGHYPDNPADLEDAQQAIRLARTRARAWHLDPARIGAVGFSAGGNLAVLMSTHPDDRHVESTPAAPDIDATVDARLNFAIVVYPAYLIVAPEPKLPPPPGAPAPPPPPPPTMPLTPPVPPMLNSVYTPNALTPPTFLIQAENDRAYGKNAPAYYQALAAAGVPTELHMYATGGHGFGTHPPGMPEEHWTELATSWLEQLHIIPSAGARRKANATLTNGAGNPGAAAAPCIIAPPPPPTPGRQPTSTPPSDDFGCP